nr:TadE/TadG family type IV pilus assembly protein [uncultured Roseibium sp.]
MNLQTLFRSKFFWRDSGGLAAVEFALVFPFLILVLINVVSFYDGFRGDKVISKVTGVVVDLVTRDRGSIDDDDFDELVAIGEALAGKYSANSDFTVVVASIRNVFDVDEDEDLELAWSRSNVDEAVLEQADLDELDLPDVGEGESVIYVMVSAEYTPMLINELIGTFTLSDNQVRRPRFVAEVTCESDSGAC